MALKEIQAIQEAEVQAEMIRRSALAKARDLQKQAEEQGAHVLSEALAQAKREGEALLKAAQAQSDQEIAQWMEQGRTQQEAIRAQAQQRLEETARFIMERIVNAHGHR